MKKRERNRTKEEIFRILLALEKNNMHQAKTSRELGINRLQLHRYIKKYWDEYNIQKKYTRAESLVIAQEKGLVLTDMKYYKDELGKLQNLAIAKLITYLETAEKIPPHLLLDIISEVAPYLVEKVATIGVNPLNELDPVTRHTTFVQNIINKMEIKNGKSSN